MKQFASGIALMLVLAISPFAQAPAGQTAADLPLHTRGSVTGSSSPGPVIICR